MAARESLPKVGSDIGTIVSESLMRGVIWALVGMIFGFLFVVLHEYFHEAGSLCLCYIYASAAAGALGALVYGSMRLSVIVASNAFVVIIGYQLLFAPDAYGPLAMTVVGGLAGMLIGTLYGLTVKDSRVYRAEAKIIAGVIAGTLASPAALVPAFFFGPIPFPWLTAILCPATGLIYVTIAPWFVKRCCHVLPAAVDGAVVGAGVGCTMGLLFWIMAGTMNSALPQQHADFISGVALYWPAAAAGASISAFFTGLARSALGVKWYDL